jgi:hypothetical protein
MWVIAIDNDATEEDPHHVYYWEEVYGWIAQAELATKYTDEQKELAGEPPSFCPDGHWCSYEAD